MNNTSPSHLNASEIHTPRFTGVFIPAEILAMEDLNPSEIILLSWIDALQNEEKGGCYASNKYLATMLRLKDQTISIMITHLKELNLIKQVGFNGRQRILIAYTWFHRHSKAAYENNHTLPMKIITPSILVKSNPLIIDSKEEIKGKNDDVDRGRAGDLCGNVDKEKPSITKDDIYHACIAQRRDWLPEEIEVAWRTYPVDKKISDPFQYVDSIIKNQRVNNEIRKEKCQTQKASNKKDDSKNPWEIVKELSAGKNSGELVSLASILPKSKFKK